MQADLCAHHKKIVNRICAKGLCSAIMCSGCFEEHQRSTNHSLAVLLNTSSLDYFLKFLKDIITKLDEILIKIEHAGISMIFQVSAKVLNYWDSKSIIAQITKHGLEIISNYKALLINNYTFVNNNLQKYSNLLHPQFFKDIYNLVGNSWELTGIGLAEDLQRMLIQIYPSRYIYKCINFAVNPVLLGQIEGMKGRLISESRQNLTEQYKQPVGLGDLRISNVESLSEEMIDAIDNDKDHKTHISIDSFYQILDNSKIAISEVYIGQSLLADIPGSISPNFLSYEELQKQIEELLRQNNKLQQSNEELKEQNRAIKIQNNQLKSIKIIK